MPVPFDLRALLLKNSPLLATAQGPAPDEEAPPASAPGAPSVPPPAPPDAGTPTSPDVSASLSPSSMTGLYQQLMGRYGLSQDPGADIGNAIAADQSIRQGANLGKTGEIMMAAMQRRAPNLAPLDPEQFNLKNYMMRRQLAQEDLQREQMLRMMPIDIATKLAGLGKTQAEVTSLQAGAKKTTAEAHGAELENGPPPQTMVALAQKYGVQVTPDMTTKTTREAVDAAARREGQQIDWARYGLEVGKVKVELARYGSEHPSEPVPGYHYVGPGGAPDRNSAPVQDLANKVAAGEAAKQIAEEMRSIYNKAGIGQRIVGPDAQRLQTLYTNLTGSLGRAASGSRLAEYDVVLSHGQLSDPTSWKSGAWRPDKVNAAIDTIQKMIDIDTDQEAKAHNYARASVPTPGAVRRFTRDASGQLVEVK